MRRSFLIFVYMFLVNKIKSSPDGDCYIEGVDELHWLTAYTNNPVDDCEEKEFTRFAVNNIDGVEVLGDDYGKYFEAKLEDRYLIIAPTQVFKYLEINEKSTPNPEINVLLNFECQTGTRQLAFYQPIRDHNTHYPEFDQPAYTYVLPMPLPGKFDVSVFGETIIACDLDISNVRLDFEVNPAEDFSLYWDGPVDDRNKCHKAILKTNGPLRLASEKVYQIIVRDRGIPSQTTIARLEVHINENNSIAPNPQFESAYYTASYNPDKSIMVVDNPIHLKHGCSKVELDVSEYKDNFRVDCNSDEITVKLVSTPSSGLWENMVVVLVTILATVERAERPGKTVLVINLPKQDCQEESTTVCPYIKPATTKCPVCPTQCISCACPPCNNTECSFTSGKCPPCSNNLPRKTISSSECSSCQTNPEQRSTVFIRFKQDNYSFEMDSSYQGFVGFVTATALPEEVIEYSADTDEAFMHLDTNTGTLKILTKMDPGIYNFTVYAEALESKIKTHTNVTINVLENTDKLNTVLSVLIEHVVENEGRFIRIPCQCDHCTYNIIEQYPETNPRLFGVYNKTQIYAVPMDREMDEIINMKVPQFTLRLVLTATIGCRTNSTSLKTSEIFREWAFIPAEVPNKPDQLLTSIIVDDANDNPPVFEAGVKLVIGYPVKSLVRAISPLCLSKVKATDLDAGENAQIRYSTDSSDFVIHPITGVIYAGDDAVSDDSNNLKFNVVATDRSGSDDGLSANLVVEIKALKKNHLIVLTIKHKMLKKLDQSLEKLSNETNLQIKYLNTAVAPFAYTEGWYGSLARIIVYGLNSNDEPVEANILENAIEESKNSKNITVDKVNFANLSGSEDSDKVSNRSNLIAAVVVLSILLVFFITIFMAFYYFKIFLAKKTNRHVEAEVTYQCD